jgi:hypothetical protein
MFVILSNKIGFYHTDAGDDLVPRETYDYLFCGQKKARFVIAELLREGKVRVTDETPPEVTTEVPSKFLPRFDTIEAARLQLQDLVRFGSMDTVLEKLP